MEGRCDTQGVESCEGDEHFGEMVSEVLDIPLEEA
jgi:hypothetical protein